MDKENKVYLGDAVYAEYDGYQIWLSTSNGIYDTNRIALEPNVQQKLIDYIDNLKKQE